MMRLPGLKIAVMLMFFFCCAEAFAVLPDEILPDQTLEERARRISSQLRCLVCRNETIDDSHAALARDLRILVRERLLAGDSDGQVVDFIVARYGDYILLKPRFGGATFVLWLSPVLVLVPAVICLFLAVRRRGEECVPPLTREEEERIRTILNDENSR